MNLFLRAPIASAILFSAIPAFAADPVDLAHQPVASLKSFTPSREYELKPIRTEKDFNQTQHSHLQQTYHGYRVFGADVIVHTPTAINAAATMNGIVYQNLQKDLPPLSNDITSTAHANQVLQQAIEHFQKKSGMTQTIREPKTDFLIYIDKNNKAHWAFWVSFLTDSPARPNYILDAMDFSIYQMWDNIQTLSTESGGGLGGNQKTGKQIYDGLTNNYPALSMQRNASTQLCYLKNTDVTVKEANRNDTVAEFNCATKNSQHGNIFWDENLDAVNGGYSPDNDALFIGQTIKKMYQEWYAIPVLKTASGRPMMLNMRVHKKMDNAYWDGREMTFGDGLKLFYPLVSLDVGAHEISHGFTEQHSNLAYFGQSGGLNESFSDMAAQAAEFYVSQKNNWQIGNTITKEKNAALRYLDEPTKDCHGKNPGDNCSISAVKDFYDLLDVHFSSGVFNKIFYKISTAAGWNTQKAFNVMVQANQHYWTPTTDFAHAACGVLKAARDYQYPTTAVINALQEAGLNSKEC